MVHILLFHSVLGLRPAEHELASALEEGGHTVALPDLFGGRKARDYAEGFALREDVGDDAIMARAGEAVAAAPEDAVLAGVSFGAYLVGAFWGTRPRMRGALLFAGVAPWMTPRRTGLPVSAHIARPDPFDEEELFSDWAAGAETVALDLHRYDGVGHYFLDRTLPDYDADAARHCLDRAKSFLQQL